MNIAVITGASSGMGREFARQIKKLGSFDEIWAIARRTERLNALASELDTPVRPITLDLTLRESIEAYSALLSQIKPKVSVLVNASGFGYFKAFTDGSLPGYYDMILLNDSAVVGMTYATLPYMGSGGRIFNICSVAAFQPLPYISIYAATKAFALSFTRAINVELKQRGIKALAVCPYWTKTEFFDTAKTDDTISYYQCYTEAKDVVSLAIKDMGKKRKDVSICGGTAKLNAFLAKLLPHKLVMRVWCRQQNKPV